MSGPVRGLGRGLSSLMGTAQSFSQESREVPLAFLHPCPFQPRRHFAEEALESLAQSIKSRGLLQPLLVRPSVSEGEERYEIVAGERRFRAARRAGLHAVPVVVRGVSDSEALEMALIENLQREALTPLEEARAYQQLLQEPGTTQEALAARVGKSRSHIANSVRLLSLPQEIAEFLDTGALTPGQARPLVGHPEAVALARRAVASGLTARQIERQAKRGPPRRHPQTEANILAAQRSLSQMLGLRVSLRHGARGGTLCISYRTLEQLDGVCRRLERPLEEPGL